MKTPIMALLAGMAVACGGGTRSDPGSPGANGAPGSMASASNMEAAEGMAGMAMGGGSIPVNARQAALAGVTVAVARRAPVRRTVRAVGMAVENERALGIVNARVSGWVEALHANETGRMVTAGEPLLELYAPELVTAQEELLLAKRLAATDGGDSLVAAARRRLALWGIAESEIAEVEATEVVRQRLTIRSPYTGHILEKHVIEGQMVRAGDRLFKIADLSTIWLEAALFESDITLVRVGQSAQVTFDALPGRTFAGRVTFIYPQLDMRTRTLKVRVEVPNAHLRIRPMMYGAVQIATAGPPGVAVPLGAVLPTGTRDLAFVVRRGAVTPTEVVVGMRGDSTVLVLDGLTAGDTVIASATFLFDSESQLAAAMAGIMLNMGMGLNMGGMQMEGMNMPTSEMGADSAESMPGMRMDSTRDRERQR